MNDDINLELSRAAQERRDQMLPELIDAMQRIHRARRVRRRILTGAIPVIAVACVITAWMYFSRPTPPNRTHVVTSDVPQSPVVPIHTADSAQPTSVTIVRVQTDPSIVDRYRAVSQSQAIVLNDESLLTALAHLNRPTGLIRSEGRAWLTSNVVDPPLNPETGL